MKIIRFLIFGHFLIISLVGICQENEEISQHYAFTNYFHDSFRFPSIAYDLGILKARFSYVFVVDSASNTFNIYLKNEMHPSLRYEFTRVFRSHPQWNNQLAENCNEIISVFAGLQIRPQDYRPEPNGASIRIVDNSEIEEFINSTNTDFTHSSKEFEDCAYELYKWLEKFRIQTGDSPKFRFPKSVKIQFDSRKEIIWIVHNRHRIMISPKVEDKSSNILATRLDGKEQYFIIGLKSENHKVYFTKEHFRPSGQTIKLDYSQISLDELKTKLKEILMTRNNR